MSLVFTDKKKILIKSDRYIPWVEISIFIILIIPYIIATIDVFTNIKHIGIDVLIAYLFFSIILLLLFIYLFFQFGENYFEIYTNYILVFPKLSDKLFNQPTLKIKKDEIKQIIIFKFGINLILKKPRKINNEIVDLIEIHLGPSEFNNRKKIKKYFLKKYPNIVALYKNNRK